MKLGFKLVEYLAGDGGRLYTIHFQGRAVSEYEAFLMDHECRADPGFGPLNTRLLHMIRQEGIEPRMFQTKNYEEPLGRLFYKPSTGLRLYCWFAKSIIIAGHGGVKSTPSLYDTPSTARAYDELLYIARRLRTRLTLEHTLIITSDGFKGNLTFDKER